MKEVDLKSISTAELVARFAILGIEEDKSEDDNARYSRLFREMSAIQKELKSRPGDQRHALMSLYSHSNIHVRLMAAKYTLAVAPQQARQTLQAIVDTNWFPQSGDAGMCLSRLDSGEFEPE
jgi:hypothetical protein